MSKCLSCLHYEVCDYRINEEDITVAECTQFTARSEWAHLPCKVGEEIWVIDREDGEAVDISCVQFIAKSKGCIIATSWINDYDIDETIAYHINETQENFDTDLQVYPDGDWFTTKEQAEQALEEERNGNG